MTTLHEFLKARLALLGPPVYVGALPQTYRPASGPAITYLVPDRPFGHVLVGADGTSQAQVEISVWSFSEARADATGQGVRNSLQGYVGDIVTAAILEDEQDIPHPPKAGSDQWTFEIKFRYQINHRVSLP